MWNIHDFTLGFKIFRREAAQDIFLYQYDNHYTAEAEIVFISRKRGWKYLELPIIWTDDRDSRVRPFKDSMRSFLGMLRVLNNYFRGKY
jgi:dolichyl-phosphate beta-glucosyltransferase